MNTIIVKTNNATQTVDQVPVITKDGAPTVITAKDKVNYEFHDTAIDRAPNHIITKRVKNDLHVSFEEEGQDSDLIIEGFYDNPDSALLGLAEDGEYYYYIPDTGETYDYVTQLEVSDVEGQALGGQSYVAAATPWWVPAAAGMGLVGLVAGISKSGGDEDDEPVNKTPIANPDSNRVAEEVRATGNVLDNDTDIDSSTLTIMEASVDVNGSGVQVAITLSDSTAIVDANGNAMGALTLNSDGSYSFVPAANFNGTVPTVNYTVTDGSGGTASSTLDIVITPVNDAPVAVDDNYTVNEDSSIALNPLKGDSDLDGDTLSITSINGTVLTGQAQVISVSNGLVSIDGNGGITFTPDANFNGTVSFPYSISDGAGGTATATATATATQTITVNAVNDDPVAVDDSYEVVEDGSVLLTPLVGDSDLDGDTLSITAINGEAMPVLGTAKDISVDNGIVSVDINGIISFTPDANFNGTVSFPYSISDGEGGSATATQTITVAPNNDAPVAVDDNYTVNEDSSIALNPLKGDSDLDGDPLSVININGTALTPGVAQSISVDNGTVNVDINGAITFTPDANFNGTVSFPYSISDGAGGSSTATQTITVTPDNDDPVANPDSNRVAEEVRATGNVLDNDTDIDSGTLTILEASVDVNGSGVQVAITLSDSTAIVDANGNAMGALTLNSDGSYGFVPAANFNGTVPTVNYTVTDGNGGTASSTLDIVIIPVNDAPVAVDDNYTVNEDSSIALNPLKGDSDLDGDTLSITAINGTVLTGQAQVISVSNGLVSIDGNGGISFTPDANFNGTVSFPYSISDGAGGTATATQTITVNAVNDDPVAVDDSYEVVEDGSVLLTPLAGDSDLDGDTLSITAINGEAMPVLGTAKDISVDNGTVSVDINGTITFTPDANFNGTVSFPYSISDGAGGSATATQTITVAPNNDAPVAVNDNYTVNEDSSIALNPLKGDSDLDGDPLSVININGTVLTPGVAQSIIVDNGTVNVDINGAITFTPDANFNGTVSFPYSISDGAGGTATATQTITVNAVNDDPVANPDSNRVAEEVTATGNVLDNDTDIDSSTLTILEASVDVNGSGTQVALALNAPTAIVDANGNAMGALTLNSDGSYSFVPAANFNGTVPTVNYTVTDGSGAASSTLDIVITPVNDAPVAVDDNYTVNEDSSIALNPLKGDSDLDGDTLSITSINGTVLTGQAQVISVSNGLVSIDGNGGISFTPDANFNGTVSFPYSISDGAGGTATATQTITVNAVNDDPVANPDSNRVAEEVRATGNVLDNDTDIDSSTLTILEASVDVNGSGTQVALTLGDPTAIVDANGNAMGALTLNSDGSYGFVPAANFNGTVPTVNYTVTDGNGTASSTLDIVITPVNDAPVAVDDNYTVNEDSSIALNPLKGDSDLDGDTLSITSINGTLLTGQAQVISVSNGLVSIDGNGGISFTPDTNFNGTVSFPYTISDGAGSSTATQTITVNAVNDAPIAVDDSYEVVEDGSVLLTPLKGDSDLDGDTLSITAINGEAMPVLGTAKDISVDNGTVSVDINGTITFTPDANFNGTVSFPYTISDGAGGSATATQTITVAPNNDAPVAVDDNYTVNEDSSIALNPLKGDSDLDGDTLSITSINGTLLTGQAQVISVSNGLVSIDGNGTISFTPDANFNGTVSFPYTITDGAGGSSTATQTITVAPNNDAPVAVNDNYTVNEDSSIALNPLKGDSDLDGDPLSVININGTALTPGIAQSIIVDNGTVNVDINGAITFNPDANFNGTVSFPYTISDGAGGTATATQTITVNAVNDDPVAVDDSYEVVEDGSVLLTPLAGDSDLDGDTLSITAINGEAMPVLGTAKDISVDNGTVNVDINGTISFTPDANFNGTVSFPYSISDGAGGSATATQTITVAPNNDAPVAVNDNYTVNEDSSIALNPLKGDSDLDGDTLSITSINGTVLTGQAQVISVSNGLVSIDGNGGISFTPDANFNGTVSFPYTISDGAGGTATATQTITVNAVNDDPVAVDDSYEVVEDGSVLLTPLAGDSDLDGDTLSITAINGEAMPVLGTAKDISVDNGIVSVDINGTITFTPDANFNGTVSFPYTISDGAGGSSTATQTITVAPNNDAPVAVNDNYTVNEDSSIALNPLKGDSDLDGDPLSVININGTALTPGIAQSIIVDNGTVNVDINGAITFNPDANFNGTVSFPYTISDGAGGTATATQTITVNAVNDDPVAVDDSYEVVEDGSVLLTPLAGDSDLDGDTLSITAINGEAMPVLGTAKDISVDNGTVNVDINGTITFTPDANFNGTVSFPYTISDGAGGSSTATQTITVAPNNDAPVAVNDNYTVNEDSSIALNPLKGDSDLDGDTLSITSINGTVLTGQAQVISVSNGLVSIDGNGGISFTPDANFNGTVSFPYTISDGAGGTATATQTITVNAVNDDPVAVDDSYEVVEDGSVLLTPLAGDSDLDGDTLSITAINGEAMPVLGTAKDISVDNGTVNVDINGAITFTPDANFNGTVSFPYSISDGAGGSATATQTITVAPNNDAPVAVNDNYTVNEDSSIALNPLKGDSDLDGDTLSITSINGTVLTGQAQVISVSNGLVSIDGNGGISFTPDANFNGTVSFPYTISDGAGSSTATQTITVNAVNDDPVVNPDSNRVAEEVRATGNVLDNDTDIDSSTLTILEASVDVNGSGTQVALALNAPTAIVDANGNAMGALTLNSDGSYSFVPAANFNGTVPTVNYTVTDGNGGTASSTLDIVIIPVNDAPVAVDDNYTVNEDSSIALNPLKGDSDLDGDTLSITAINGTVLTGQAQVISVSNGLVSIDGNGGISFTPDANFNGTVSFPYSISDGAGGTATATQTITVNAVNDDPVVNPDSNRVAEEVRATGNVLDNDTDIDSSTLTIMEASVDVNGSGTQAAITLGDSTAIVDANGNAMGALTLNSDGSYSFVPAANFNGTVPTVNYTVTDGSGGTASSTLDIVITPVNDAPVAVDDNYTVNEDSSIALNPLKGDSDLDGDTLSITSINGTVLTGQAQVISVSNGLVSIDGNGGISFTPDANFNGTVSFPYTISDGAGGTATATQTITVNAVNDDPVAVDDSYSMVEDGSVLLTPLKGDSDIDGDTLSITAINGEVMPVLGTAKNISVDNGTVSVDINGTITFTPDANFNGTVSFPYTISDGEGGSATATQTITVAPNNDAPVAVDDNYTVNEDSSIALNPLKGDSDLDGDPLSVININGTVLTGQAQVISVSNGLVSIDGNGGISFTPDANFNGTVSFPYTISDGAGSSTATQTITVTPDNDDPVAVDDSYSMVEDGSVLLTPLVGDSDIDGDTLSITAINGEAMPVLGTAKDISVDNGTVNVDINGAITFTPDANFNGTVSFPYSISDGAGGSATATQTITVAPNNDAPVAVDDNYTVNEDSSIALNPLKGDSDLDGDPLSVININGTALTPGVAQSIIVDNGTVNVDINGAITFTPDTNFNGTVSFPYTISDGAGGTATATQTITVNAVNDAPIAVDDSYEVVEDGSVLLTPLKGDSDLDGDTLSITAINGEAMPVLGTAKDISVDNGTVNVDINGTISFTPDANFNGTVSFPYSISDGAGGSATATQTITVAPNNDAPVAVDDNYTVNEDSSIALNPLKGDSDLDGDPLSVININGTALTGQAQVISVSNGLVSIDGNGGISFTPDANFNGTVSFPYSISDGAGGTATATQTITVNAVNDDPVVNPDSNRVAEEVRATGNVLDNDTDIDSSTLTIMEASVDVNGSGTQAAITLGDSTAIVDANGNAMGALTLNSDGSYSFVPAANFNGTVPTVNYTVTDGSGGTASSTLDIVITPVNDAPVAVDDNYTVNEDSSIALNPLKGDSDLDGDTLSITSINGTVLTGQAQVISVSNGLVSIDGNGGISFTPDANFNGTVSFPYTISDGAGGTATATQTITVNAVNDDPVAVDDSYSMVEDGSVLLTPLKGDSDIDGDTLSITAINGEVMPVLGTAKNISVDNGTVSVDINGTITFTPDANFNGTVSFPYTISDGEGGSATATQTITVAPNNDAPVAVDDNYTVNEDSSIALNPLKGDSDLDGDPLSVININGTVLTGQAQVISVSNGLVSIDGNGGISFTPDANFNGTVSFPYTISDGAGSSTATQTITVTPDNDDPVAVDDSYSMVEDGSVLLTPLVGDSDIDGDTLSITAINGEAMPVLGTAKDISVDNGTVNVDINGAITFTPDANFNGTVSFPYSISDGAGGSATATQTITVAPNNDAPVAVDDNYTVNEDSSIALNPLKGDSDLDGDPLSVININGTALTPGVAQSIIVDNGTVNVDINGAITFTPDTNFNGTVSFPYTISDGAGGTATATQTITVNAVNDAPIAVDDSYEVVEDGSVLLTPLKGDSDLDGDTLSITAINGEAMPVLGTAKDISVDNGTVNVDINGTISFTPDANFNGTVSFPYSISDGAGGSATATQTITVAPNNDAPVAVDDNYTVNEDSSIALNPLKGDSDLDGDPLSVININGTALTGQAQVISVSNGLVSIDGNGGISFTPDTNFNGTVSFPYTISDGAGSSTATQTITVNAVNDDPVVNPDSNRVAEEVRATGNVLDNDTDIDSSTLTIMEASVDVNGSGTQVALALNAPTAIVDANGNAMGALTLNSDGSYGFVPAANFNGTVPTVNYTVTDGNGGTASSTLDIVITPVNDPPVAVNDNYTVNEDSSIALNPLKGDSDLDGDPLSVININGTALTPGIAQSIIVDNGTVNVDINGAITFNPDANFNGTVSFPYTISDGAGGTATATQTITVNAVNDDPVAVDDSYEVVEDGSVLLTPLKGDSDLDGDTLSITAINGEAMPVLGTAKDISVDNGIVSVDINGTITFTPDANFNGTVSFPYTISDGEGGSSTATQTITVAPNNDAPVAVDDNYTVNEDSSIALNPLKGDSDLDGDPLSVININGTALTPGVAQSISVDNGMVNVDINGAITFTPDGNFNGTVSFPYSISDGAGGTATATQTITVNAVNDDPVAVDDSYEVVEDGSVLLTPLAGDSDLDGDTLSITAINGEAMPVLGTAKDISVDNGTVNVDINGAITFTPDANFNGTVSFPYSISDGAGGSATATQTITVAPNNDAPVAVDDNYTVNEDSSIALNPLKGDSDLDGDPLSVININGTALTPGVAQSIIVDNGTVNVDINGAITFTPDTNFNGTVSFPYTISDGAGGTATATQTITVNAVNDAPIAVDDSYEVVEDGSVLLTPLAGDSDLDGDTLSITAINGEAMPVLGTAKDISVDNGTVNVDINGAITFTPDANFNGTVSFPYSISDGAGGSATATQTITVAPNNDAPVAVNDNYTVNEDSSIALNPLKGDSDLDGDTLSITSINGTVLTGQAQVISVSNGLVSIDGNGGISFTPDANFNGTVSFPYTISDGAGGTATATQTITVNAVNDDPVAVDDSENGISGQPTTINVINNDTDLENNIDPKTVKLIDALGNEVTSLVVNGEGTWTVNIATGAVTFTPISAFNSDPTPVRYVVSDKDGLKSNPATITLDYPNLTPQANPDARALTEDLGSYSLSGSVLDNDNLGNTPTQSFTWGNEVASYGSVTKNADGSYSYTLNNNSSAVQELAKDQTLTEEFNYIITDQDGQTSSSKLTITITGTNDRPVITNDAIGGVIDSRQIVEQTDQVTITQSGVIKFTDVDATDTLSLNYVKAQNQFSYGSGNTLTSLTAAQKQALENIFTVTKTDADQGSWNINATSTALDFIPIGQSITVRYAVQVNDGKNVTTAANGNALSSSEVRYVEVTITGTNDTPILVNDTARVREDNVLTANLFSNGTNDIDIGEKLTVESYSINGTSYPVTVAAGSNTAQDVTIDTIKIGSILINSDGSYTFTPVANFSGKVPEITVQVSNGLASSNPNRFNGEETLNITVNPVSDKPALTAVSVSTPEDTKVALGLTAPTITDRTDLNGTGNFTDNPERIGLITLNGVPNGAVLSYGSTSFTSTGSNITILISDFVTAGKIISNPGTPTITMTAAEFEGLQLTPPRDSATNISINMSATEYEVDNSGNVIKVDGNGTIVTTGGTAIAGATTTVKVNVDVQAVTDSADKNASGDNASSFGYQSGAIGVSNKTLTVTRQENEFVELPITTTFGDLVGGANNQETYGFVLTGLNLGAVIEFTPAGSNTAQLYTVGASGQLLIGANQNGSGTITGTSLVAKSGTAPKISIKSGEYDSKDMSGITVSLYTQDHDSDSSPKDKTVELIDTVNVNLTITPIAGQVEITSNAISTTEDTAITLDTFGFDVLDDKSGTANANPETITRIEFTLLEGWTYTNASGSTIGAAGGTTISIDTSSAPNLNTFLEGLSIKPPAQSSKDADFVFKVTSEDIDDDGGNNVETTTTLPPKKVTVTPVAEAIGESTIIDTDGDTVADLTINPNHTYTAIASEDATFNLGTNGSFRLQTGWSNQDDTVNFGQESHTANPQDSEETYAHLRFGNNDATGFTSVAGAVFSYTKNSVVINLTDNGSGVDIPAAYLNSVTVKPPLNYSDFNLASGASTVVQVQAKTIDYDEDTGVSTTPVMSGESYLTLVVEGVADPTTLSVASAVGTEDQAIIGGNNRDTAANMSTDVNPTAGIPLKITPSSRDNDGSETYGVTISDIPVGAKLYIDNGTAVTELTITNGSVTINDYTNVVENLYFVPAENFSGTVALKVTSTSQENDGDISAANPPLTLSVKVTGKADTISNDSLKVMSDNGKNYTYVTDEATVDSTSTIAMSSLFEDASNIVPYDNGTPTVEQVGYRVEGLSAGFDLSGVGVTFLGGSGTGRVWSVTLEALNNDTAQLKVPNNFAGDVNFTITDTTTETISGDSTSHGTKPVSILIKPDAADSTMNNPQIDATEDLWTTINFNAVFESTDTANVANKASGYEALETLIISADFLLAADLLLRVDGNNVTLTAGQNVTINASQKVEFKYDNDKLHSDDAINIPFSYTYTDSTTLADGSVVTATSPVISGKEVNVTFQAVTDQPAIALNSTDNTISNSGTDDTLSVTVSMTSPDTDGSESFTRLEVTDVPEGLIVVGGILSDSIWYVDIVNDAITANPATYELVLELNKTSPNIPEGTFAIKVTGVTQDINGEGSSGSEARATETIDIVLSRPVDSDDPTNTATLIANFDKEVTAPSQSDEDASIVLGNVLNATLVPNLEPPVIAYTFFISSLPAGTAVQSSSSDVSIQQVNGVYLIEVKEASNLTPEQALNTITVTPPLNFSTNESGVNQEFNFDVIFTTLDSDGREDISQIDDVKVTIKPFTDPMDVEGKNSTVQTAEDTTVNIDINLKNKADGDYVELVDGKLYIQLNETQLVTGTGPAGVLTDANDNVLQPVTLPANAVGNIPAGTYYVLGVTDTDVSIDGINPPDNVTIKYTPAANADGSAEVKVYTAHKEVSDIAGHDSGTLTYEHTYDVSVSKQPDNLKITSSADGTSAVVTGDEDTLIAIDYKITNIDEDDTANAISLDNVPNGYVVYYTNTSGVKVIANNNGDIDSDGNNLWSINTSNLGAAVNGDTSNVFIKPPEDVSGTAIKNIEMKVINNSGSVSEPLVIDLDIRPIADGVTFNPTTILGSQGKWALLNLNTSMSDVDGSESVTMVITDGGNNLTDDVLRFRIKSTGDLLNAFWDESANSYTLTGITPDQLNELQLQSSIPFDGSLNFALSTVDSTGSTSDVSSAVTKPVLVDIAFTSVFDGGIEDDILNASGQNKAVNYKGGAGNDTLIGGSAQDTLEGGAGNDYLSGNAGADILRGGTGDDTLVFQMDNALMDGGAGFDTLLSDSTITIDFDSFNSSVIDNMEVIELGDGAQTLTNLSASDVIAMTDSGNQLFINGDSNDQVSLIANDFTKQQSSNQVGYDQYQSTANPAVTLYVDTDITVI